MDEGRGDMPRRLDHHGRLAVKQWDFSIGLFVIVGENVGRENARIQIDIHHCDRKHNQITKMNISGHCKNEGTDVQ